jgi:multiple sugar transport system permease protein
MAIPNRTADWVSQGQRSAPAASLNWRKIIQTAIFYPLTIGLSVIFMLPFLWTVLSSIKTPWEMYEFPPVFWPAVPQWGNYAEAMTIYPFATWYWNTAQVVVLNTAGVLLTSSLVAYGFARFDFRFKNVLFIMTLATIMIPAQITLIPRYILFYQLGWINTLLPLWVPAWFGGTAFAIFLMRQFIMSLPRELDEAALVDGASYFRIFWNIIAPLCKPALATLAIIVFIANWNNFLEPLVYLNSRENFTVALGLRFLQSNPQAGGERPTGHLLMAASVTSILPPILLFFMFQRYFVRGIALSGLKG